MTTTRQLDAARAYASRVDALPLAHRNNDAWNPRPGVTATGVNYNDAGPGWQQCRCMKVNPGQAVHGVHVGWLVEGLQAIGREDAAQLTEPMYASTFGYAAFKEWELDAHEQTGGSGQYGPGWVRYTGDGTVSVRPSWWTPRHSDAVLVSGDGYFWARVTPGWRDEQTRVAAPESAVAWLSSLSMNDAAKLRLALGVTDPVPQPPTEPPVEPPVDPPVEPPTEPPPPIDDERLVEIVSRLEALEGALDGLADRIEHLPAGPKGDKGRGVRVFAQSSEPSDAEPGDVWFVT